MPAFPFIGLALLVVPLASAAAEPIRVTGKILTEQGTALSGARLELFPAHEEYAAAIRRVNEQAGPVPLAKARTNAEGSFDLLAPESGCRPARKERWRSG
jgi:hypothetical protein